VRRNCIISAKIRVTPNGRKLAYFKNIDSWNDYGIRVSNVFDGEVLAYRHLEEKQEWTIAECQKELRETKEKIKELENEEAN